MAALRTSLEYCRHRAGGRATPAICLDCLRALSERVERLCVVSDSAIATAKAAIEESRARLARTAALATHLVKPGEPDGRRRDAWFEPRVRVEALARLHQMTARFLRGRSLGPLLEDALDALMLVTGARLGNVQLVNGRTGALTIAVQHGFRHDFLDFFAEVPTHGSACGVALRDRRRVVVPDVAVDPVFTEASRRVLRGAGVRAVQSTPLVGMSGNLVGVVSTHYREPGVADPGALQMVDFYARQIATLIESARRPMSTGRAAPIPILGTGTAAS